MNSYIKAIAKAHLSKGLVDGIRKTKEEWSIHRIHRSALKKVGPFLQMPQKQLNLGCGRNYKPGWINIDLFDPGAQLQLDLREKWPFTDDSVTLVYSEHIFEYFELHEEVPHFLLEARRVLQPGGTLDIGVPDAECPLRAYGNPNDSYWETAKRGHPNWCETQLDHINFTFREDTSWSLLWQHKYAWDQDTLVNILLKFGFVDIARREFDPALDDESRRIGTLHMRAIKPDWALPESIKETLAPHRN